MQQRAQVLVLGAGPAGLATAIACAMRGLRVVVLEQRQVVPIDKACGEGLMPDAVIRLESLGVRPRGQPLVGIRYRDERSDVRARFPRACGLGVRRVRLSSSLLSRANEVGVEVREGEAVHRLVTAADGPADHTARPKRQRPGFIADRRRPEVYAVESTSGVWTADLIVAADGARSLARHCAGWDVAPGLPERVGVRQHFAAVPALGAQPVESGEAWVEVFWGAHGVEGYWTPVTTRTAGLAFLLRACRARAPAADDSAPLAECDRRGSQASARSESRGSVFERQVEHFPELSQRLERARVVSRTLGAGPLACATLRHGGGNLALVGDAGGYVDAITGEGLAIAFAEAQALADRAATALGDSTADDDSRRQRVHAGLERYHRDARRIRRLPDLITRGALLLSAHPGLRRRFLRALEREPALFGRLLALHVREIPQAAGVPLAVRLGWRLALAGR